MISIVDDDRSVRESLKALVRSFGYEADAFESAKQFLCSDRQRETTCLIVDVQMPGFTGLDLQAQLLAKGCQTPVIFMTAYPSELTRAQAIRDGALGYFSKPLNEYALMACIDRALNQ